MSRFMIAGMCVVLLFVICCSPDDGSPTEPQDTQDSTGTVDPVTTPILLLPADDVCVFNNKQTFSWVEDPAAGKYELKITSIEMSGLILFQTDLHTPTCTLSLDSILGKRSGCAWQVRAFNRENVPSTWASPRKLYLANRVGLRFTAENLTLLWTDSKGVSGPTDSAIAVYHDIEWGPPTLDGNVWRYETLLTPDLSSLESGFFPTDTARAACTFDTMANELTDISINIHGDWSRYSGGMEQKTRKYRRQLLMQLVSIPRDPSEPGTYSLDGTTARSHIPHYMDLFYATSSHMYYPPASQGSPYMVTDAFLSSRMTSYSTDPSTRIRISFVR